MRLVCLANSIKLSSRCVAGIDLKQGRWVRPVSRLHDGILSPIHYWLPGKQDPRPLDILDIGLDAPSPNYQPENWLIDDRQWQLAGRLEPSCALETLHPFCSTGPAIFGTTDDRTIN